MRARPRLVRVGIGASLNFDHKYIINDTGYCKQSLLACHDHIWSYRVMKRVRIADLKSKLSECLRAVQGGESITVLDRNTPIVQIVPLSERPGIRIRKPAPGSP